MSRQDKVKAVVSRVLAEFRSEWKGSRARVLNDQLETATNSYGIKNLGHSNALTFKHQELYDAALSGARDLFVARIEMVFGASQLKPREDLAVALVQACHDELREFSATFDNELVRSQKLMGLGNAPIPDTTRALETLRATTATAVSGAIARYAESHATAHQPWVQRSLGYLVITIFAGLFILAVSLLVKNCVNGHANLRVSDIAPRVPNVNYFCAPATIISGHSLVVEG